MATATRSGRIFLAGVWIFFCFLSFPQAAAPLTLHRQLNPMSAINHRITVPEGGSLLSAKIIGGSGDLDLFLKKGSPFKGTTLSQIRNEAEVYSSGEGWQEVVALSRSSSPALSAGQWYLAVLNLNNRKTLYTASVFLEPQTASPTRLYFPYIVESDVWHTEICLLNCSNFETVSGKLVPYSLSGSQLAGSRNITLTPNARLELQVAKAFPDSQDIFYIVFSPSTDTVKGYAKVYVDGIYRVALPATSTITAGDLSVPHIASNSKWDTEISLLNTTAETKTLTIEFNTGQKKSLTLAPAAYKTFTIGKLFGGVAQPKIDSAVIRNAGGILGVELFSDGSQRILDGLLLEDETADEIFFPHTAITSGWGTGIVVYNPESQKCNLTLTPFSAAGASLPPVRKSLPGGQKYIGMVAALGFPSNAAWVRVEASHPVSGFELFAKYNQMAGYSGVNLSGRNGLFPDVAGPDVAGIAFINQDTSPAKLSLEAYDRNGGVVATKNMTLGVHEKRVNLAENFFSESIAKATHIRFTSDRQVVGFQLSSSKDATMLDGLGAMRIPSPAEIAGDGIVELTARALEQGDQEAFVALLSQSSRGLVEAMGNQFNLATPAGAMAAVDLAHALRSGKPTLGNRDMIHYETEVQGETFKFYVGFDGDAGEWRLGGL
jgi:hypothetical protein